MNTMSHTQEEISPTLTPYSRIPLLGFLLSDKNITIIQCSALQQWVDLPVKRWGNLTGNITVSLSDSLATFKPAMSSQCTFGFTATIASVVAEREGGREGKVK